MTNNKKILGLKKGIVKLIPYTTMWKDLFEEEKTRLQTAIGQYILDIQHVGSTSIPNIVAKPILDIAVAVKNYEEAKICIQPLQNLGYQYRGEAGIPRRHYFAKGNPRTHHLHMNEQHSQDWHNQILFRDYLLKHPTIATDYATLKLNLAQKYPQDRDAYLQGKADFILNVLALAK